MVSMLPTYSVGSSKPIKVIVHPKISSPKSVTTYIKELKDADNLERKSETLFMSQNASKDDPTKLNNILNALKSTSKGTYSDPQNSETIDALEEVCDFKNVGDLSHISFSGENSFLDSSSGEEEESDSEADTELESYLRPDAERIPEEGQELGVFGLEVLLDQLQLQQERITGAQTRRLRMHDEYLQGLLQIRRMALHNHCKALSEMRQLRIAEQQQLEHLQQQAELEIKSVENSYLKWRHQRKQELEEELAKEATKLQTPEAPVEDEIDKGAEAEESGDSDFPADSPNSLDAFKEKLLSVQTKAEGQTLDSLLHRVLFEDLPSVAATGCEHPAEFAHAHKVLLDIDAALQGGPPSPTDGPEETAPLPQPAESPQEPSIGKDSPLEEEKHPPPPVDSPPHNVQTEESERWAAELRAKSEAVSREADAVRSNAHLRPRLSRVVGIVNTIRGEAHDPSNRGKLQQVLNLLAERPCTVGDESLSTKGVAGAQAFAREQLASRLVALAHDKQAASMGVYASLIVRISQLHPAFGDLILHRLLEACPFLAPRRVQRHPGCTETQFYQSLGFRQREGGPLEPVHQYLTRMGNLAQLYGRIVSLEVEGDPHPHGLQHGWVWMARTLSLPPYPSVTAALLRGFLSTAGTPLFARYGHQFAKMLTFLTTHYMPQIEQDALDGGKADVACLRTLLMEYNQTGKLPVPPEGYKTLI